MVIFMILLRIAESFFIYLFGAASRPWRESKKKKKGREKIFRMERFVIGIFKIWINFIGWSRFGDRFVLKTVRTRIRFCTNMYKALDSGWVSREDGLGTGQGGKAKNGRMLWMAWLGKLLDGEHNMRG